MQANPAGAIRRVLCNKFVAIILFRTIHFSHEEIPMNAINPTQQTYKSLDDAFAFFNKRFSPAAARVPHHHAAEQDGLRLFRWRSLRLRRTAKRSPTRSR